MKSFTMTNTSQEYGTPILNHFIQSKHDACRSPIVKIMKNYYDMAAANNIFN